MMRSRQVSPVPEIGTPGLRWRGLETAYGEPKRARSWKRRIQPRGAYGALRQSSTLHLLDNALKYTAPGGEVRLITGQVHTDAVLRVRDTGEGIRAELRERVFDLFVQEPQALDRSRGGLGLGLALVKQLVDHRWETDRELAPVPRARARQPPEAGGRCLVALSGYGQAEDQRRALASGFDAHLTKPIEPTQLEDFLARH